MWHWNPRHNGPLPGAPIPGLRDVDYARPSFNAGSNPSFNPGLNPGPSPSLDPRDNYYWRGGSRSHGADQGQGHYDHPGQGHYDHPGQGQYGHQGHGHYNDRPAGHYARGQSQGHYGRGQGRGHYGRGQGQGNFGPGRYDRQDQDHCDMRDDGLGQLGQDQNDQDPSGEGQLDQGQSIQQDQGQGQNQSGQDQSRGGGDCQESQNQPTTSGNPKNRGQNIQGHANQSQKRQGQANQGHGQGQHGQGKKKRSKRGRWRSGPSNQQTNAAYVNATTTKLESEELLTGTGVPEIPLPKQTPPRKSGKRPKNAAAVAKGKMKKKNKRSKVKATYNVTFDARQMITSIRREHGGTSESMDITEQNENETSFVGEKSTESTQTKHPEMDIVKSNSTGEELSSPCQGQGLNGDSNENDVVFSETVVDNTMEVFDMNVEPTETATNPVPLESAERQPISSTTQNNFKSDQTEYLERKTFLREIPLEEKDNRKPSDPRLSARVSTEGGKASLRETPRPEEKCSDERKSYDPRDSWRYERTREPIPKREVGRSRRHRSPWKRNTNSRDLTNRADSWRRTAENRSPLGSRNSSSRSSSESPRKRLSNDRGSSGTPSKRQRRTSPLPGSGSRRVPNSGENRRNDFFNRDVKYRLSSPYYGKARGSTPSRNCGSARRRYVPAHSPREKRPEPRSDGDHSAAPREVNNNQTPATASFSIKQTMVFKCPCGEKWKLPLATKKIYIDDSFDKTGQDETKRNCEEVNEKRDTEKWNGTGTCDDNVTRDRSASKPRADENYSQKSNASPADRIGSGAHVEAQMIFKFLADFTCGCGQNVKKCAPCRALKINGTMEKFD